MELQFAFDENSDFKKKLDAVFKATGDLTIPLTLMAKEWFRGNNSVFDSKRKGPGRYADLSPKYKIAKQKAVGFIYPILRRSGRLAESITDPRSADSVNLILNKNELVLGSKVPYGVYHQSSLPRTKMPYRPFLFLGVEQIAPNDIKQKRLENWFKILDSFFEQTMEGKNG